MGEPALFSAMGEKNDRAAGEAAANSFMMLTLLGAVLTFAACKRRNHLAKIVKAPEQGLKRCR